MSALLTGALISGGIGIGKAIIGGVQAASGTRQLNRLLKNRPTYTIPEAYGRALSVYSNLASSQMPGQQYYEDKIGESSARQINASERGAISSNVLQGSLSNIQDKEIQAIQNLAKMGAEWKTQQQQNYAEAQNKMGQLQDKAWDWNTASPYDIKLNMANEQKLAGQSNFFGGLSDVGAVASNFVGTSYYQKMMDQFMKTR